MSYSPVFDGELHGPTVSAGRDPHGALVHLVFVTGFKNRFATLLSWTIAFIGRGRPERTITLRQALGPSQDNPPTST